MPVPGSTFTPISTARSRSHTVGSNSSPSASRHDIDPHNRPRIDSARGSRTQIPPSRHPERCPSVSRTRHRQIIPGGGVPSRAHDETNSRPRVMTFSLSRWGDRINELRQPMLLRRSTFFLRACRPALGVLLPRRGRQRSRSEPQLSSPRSCDVWPCPCSSAVRIPLPAIVAASIRLSARSRRSHIYALTSCMRVSRRRVTINFRAS